jgi:hypothetical protein
VSVTIFQPAEKNNASAGEALTLLFDDKLFDFIL